MHVDHVRALLTQDLVEGRGDPPRLGLVPVIKVKVRPREGVDSHAIFADLQVSLDQALSAGQGSGHDDHLAASLREGARVHSGDKLSPPLELRREAMDNKKHLQAEPPLSRFTS